MGSWRKLFLVGGSLSGAFSMGQILASAGIVSGSVIRLQSFCRAIDGNKGLSGREYACNL